MKFFIDFEPIGQRQPCSGGETILEAAQQAGIMLNATCGGEGICGNCIVRVMTGAVSAPNENEQAELGEEAIRQDMRLACQAHVLGDERVHIPPESLATAQRTQTEGREVPLDLHPAVQSVEVSLPSPTIHDLRSDATRLEQALGIPGLQVPLDLLRTLPDDLRSQAFSISVFVRDTTLVGVGPPGTSALGFAVDLGTTKLAGYLVDLASGKTLSSIGQMNPQIAYGEDVMARISHTMNKSEGGEQLRSAVVAALNEMAGGLCHQVNRSPWISPMLLWLATPPCTTFFSDCRCGSWGWHPTCLP